MPFPQYDKRTIRIRLCDRAEYLHHLYRVQENSDVDLSSEIETWEKLVDDSARELAEGYALEQLEQADQKR